MTLTAELGLNFPSGFSLDVSFRSENSSLALFGPSGSGKTTILHALAGLIRPQRGTIRLGERTVFDSQAGIDLPPRERNVGLVLQEGLLFPTLSVRENLLFGAPKEGARLSLERVAELLEISDLLERSPRGLSGGERQRVALGRAVLSEPKLLLCDEPFAALDVPRRRRLVRVLARLRDVLKIPLVLVSHDVSEVLALASEVVILDGGRVRAQGLTVSLLAELAGDDGVAPNFWEGVVEGSASTEKKAGVNPATTKTEGSPAATEGSGPSADRPGAEGSTLQRVRVSTTRALLVPIPGAVTGQRIRLSVEPRHVSLELAGGTVPTASPRNRLQGTVVALAPSDGLLRVTVDAGIEVAALVTPSAAQELGLAAGTEVVACFKAAAIEVLAVGS